MGKEAEAEAEAEAREAQHTEQPLLLVDSGGSASRRAGVREHHRDDGGIAASSGSPECGHRIDRERRCRQSSRRPRCVDRRSKRRAVIARAAESLTLRFQKHSHNLLMPQTARPAQSVHAALVKRVQRCAGLVPVKQLLDPGELTALGGIDQWKGARMGWYRLLLGCDVRLHLLKGLAQALKFCCALVCGDIRMSCPPCCCSTLIWMPLECQPFHGGA